MPSVILYSEAMISRRKDLALNLNVASYISSPKPNFFNSTDLSHRYPSVVYSRYLRKCCINMCDGRFSHSLHKDSDNSHNIEFRFPSSSSHDATKFIQNLDEGSSSNNSTSMIKSIRESRIYADAPALDISFNSYLKFALLCGFFILQGTGQAAAGSDCDTGFQSNSFFGDLSDISTGFTSAFLLIFFSELGDKTFFIAALLAARNSSAVVFLGTFGALGVMTIISVVLGRTFHYIDDILPFRFGDTDLPIDDIAAVLLLVYFGVSTLLDASSGDGMQADEEQKEAELAVSEFSGNGSGILAAASTVLSTFLLVFVAEWGDKSFFSTIALAAASSPIGVIGGALSGHGFATMLAVLGGSILGNFLSEKVIAYVGGYLFLVFAALTLIEIVHS